MSVDAELINYFASREQHRHNQVVSLLGELSERERALFREAAVMGYVRGTMAAAPSARPEIPRGSAIVWEVVDACRGFPKLYPTITGWVEEPDDEDEEDGE